MGSITKSIKVFAIVFIIIFILYMAINNVQFVSMLNKINSRVSDLFCMYLKWVDIDAVNTAGKKGGANTGDRQQGGASGEETSGGRHGLYSSSELEANGMKPGEADNFFMTFEEVESMENLELRQKLTGISILSKVAKDDMEKIYPMIEGGITFKEMGEIRRILEKYLSDAEIDALYELLEISRAINKKEKHVRK